MVDSLVLCYLHFFIYTVGLSYTETAYLINSSNDFKTDGVHVILPCLVCKSYCYHVVIVFFYHSN